MKRLKIVFHLNGLDQGGAERVVTTLANRFSEDHDVSITTMWIADNEYEIDPRIKRVCVGAKEDQENKSRLAKIICSNKNLRNFLKEEKPDIVISFTRKANYRALIATMGTKIPVIISVRTNPYIYYRNFKDRFWVSLLYPRVAGCVFQTIGARSYFGSKIQEKSRIILNPINPKYLNVPKPEKRKKEIVQSGRIVDFKNQRMLIEAFVLVHETHPDYVLKLYGPDSKDGTWEILEECIRDNKASEYVFLMGGSNQLEKDLPEASVFAFSSDSEGLPNALMEAMAMGMPIVATDCACGGAATLITNEKNGLLIPVNNKIAMAEAINRLIENPEYAEQLGEEARKIIDIANADEICKQWENYINFVCEGQQYN